MTAAQVDTNGNEPLVSLAQIGCGGRATQLISSIAPGIRPVVCCDLREEAARAMQERFGFARISADAEAAASDPAVGLISIVLPPDLHAPMVQRLAPLGKPMMVEKPLSPFEEPARAAVEVVRRAGVPVAVGHQYRYFAWARAIAERLRQGEIGDVYTVLIEHSYYQRSSVPWLRQHERYVTVSMNCHYFDLVRHLLQDEVDRVYAHVGQEPTRRQPDALTGDTQTPAIMHLRRGAVFNLFAHEDTRGGTPAWPLRLTLCGTRGSMFYQHAPRPDGPRLEIFSDATGRREAIPLDPNAPQANLLLLREFLACVRAGRPPPTSIYDHMQTLAVAFACYKSAARDAVVKVQHFPTYQ